MNLQNANKILGAAGFSEPTPDPQLCANRICSDIQICQLVLRKLNLRPGSVLKALELLTPVELAQLRERISGRKYPANN